MNSRVDGCASQIIRYPALSDTLHEERKRRRRRRRRLMKPNANAEKNSVGLCSMKAYFTSLLSSSSYSFSFFFPPCLFLFLIISSTFSDGARAFSLQLALDKVIVQHASRRVGQNDLRWPSIVVKQKKKRKNERKKETRKKRALTLELWLLR